MCVMDHALIHSLPSSELASLLLELVFGPTPLSWGLLLGWLLIVFSYVRVYKVFTKQGLQSRSATASLLRRVYKRWGPGSQMHVADGLITGLLDMEFTILLVQLSIFLIDLFVGTYRLSSHARLEAFVIQTKLKLITGLPAQINKRHKASSRTSELKATYKLQNLVNLVSARKLHRLLSHMP